ncbi:hypothetical protein MHTCC0001_10200 [Flavobacteriaceae bacterium MHTCC 0001]
MKKITLIIFLLVFFLGYSQTEITKTVTVDATGWKRVARLDGATGRGYNEVTIMTTGGVSTPRVAKISWFKGWSNYGGLNIESVTDNGFWSDARLTYDGVKAYLEINFTRAIPQLRVHLDQSAWMGGNILDGTLPNGGGTTVLSAKFGRLNFGENDLFLAYDGKLGIGTSEPKYKLSVSKGAFNVEKNGDYYGFWVEDKLRTDNPKMNLGAWYNNKAGISYNSSGRYLTFDTQNGTNSYHNTLVLKDGTVGIGTTTPDSKLTVAGNIHAQEVKVTVNAGADFVFEEDYDLPPLQTLEQFIKTNKHLPEIASEKEMQENGLHLAEMNIKLLQKIEELTLYTIKQDKQIKVLEQQNNRIKALEEANQELRQMLKQVIEQQK